MAVYKGGQKIEDLYCGSAKIGKIYKGSTLVYSSVKYYTFTINPTPSNATVKINNQTTKSVTVAEGTSISWSVSASGYTTQSGTLILTANTTKNVALAKVQPLYYCYRALDHGYYYYVYAKSPLGSDTQGYCTHSSGIPSYTVQATKASDLALDKVGSNIYYFKSLSENSAVYLFFVLGTWEANVTRYTAGDLYK